MVFDVELINKAIWNKSHLHIKNSYTPLQLLKIYKSLEDRHGQEAYDAQVMVYNKLYKLLS